MKKLDNRWLPNLYSLFVSMSWCLTPSQLLLMMSLLWPLTMTSEFIPTREKDDGHPPLCAQLHYRGTTAQLPPQSKQTLCPPMRSLSRLAVRGGAGATPQSQPLPLLRPAWPFPGCLSAKRGSLSVDKQVQVSTSSFKTPFVFNFPLFLGKLLLPETSQVLSPVIDSGADANLIDKELVRQLHINRVSLHKSVLAGSLDGHLLGIVRHQMKPVILLMSGNNHETIQYHILSSPQVDWSARAIFGWSFCHQLCLKQAAAMQHSLSKVSIEYHELNEAFCETKPMSLPPHRPYDCAIASLAQLPKGNSTLFLSLRGKQLNLH